MTFRVEQKVTLKNNDPWPDFDYEDEIFPEHGVVYTIRAIDLNGVDETYLRFMEIRNIPHDYDDEGHGELNFYSDEFEIVVEAKTDISVFTRMLTDQQVDA